jgi:hypothetical protein
MALMSPPLRASNEHLLLPYTILRGSGQGCPSLRASNEHCFIVRVLRARRAPGRSLPILPRARVARAQRTHRGPSQDSVNEQALRNYCSHLLGGLSEQPASPHNSRRLLLQPPIRCSDGRARHSVGQHTVQVCFPPSRLCLPVSRRVSAVSSRTLVNNAG